MSETEAKIEVKSSSKKMRYIKLAGNVLTIVALALLVKAFASQNIDYSILLQPRTLISVIVCSILFAAVVYCQALAWKLNLEFLIGKRIGFVTVGRVYLKANLGKYLPGNVMHFAARNLLGTRLGASQGAMASASVIEVGLLCVTGVLWSLLLVGGRFFELFAQFAQSVSVWIVVAAIVLIIAVIGGGLWYLRKKGRRVGELLMRFKSKGFIALCAKVFALDSVFLFVPAFIMLYICSWGMEITLANAFVILGAYIVSWLIGFMIPGAPGGIGIREAILTLMLTGVCPAEFLMVATIVSRLVSIVGDVVAYLGSLGMRETVVVESGDAV